MASTSDIIINILANTQNAQNGLRSVQAGLAKMQATGLNSTALLRAGAIGLAGAFATSAVSAAGVGIAAVGAATIGVTALLGLGAAVAGIGILAAASSKEVKTAYSGLGSYLKGQAQAVSKPISDALINNVQTIKDAFLAMKENLRSTFVDVAGFVNDSFKQLKPIAASLGTLFKVGFGTARPFLDQLVGGIKPLLDAFTTFFGVLKTNTPALLQFSGALGGLIIGILPVIGQLITALTPLATQITQNILPVIQGIADAIIGLLPTAKAFGGTLVAAVGLLTPVFKALGAILPSVTQALTNMLVNIDPAPFAAAMTALGNAIIQIAPSFTTLINAIAPLLPMLIDALVPVIISLAELFTKLAPAIETALGFVAAHPDIFTGVIVGGTILSAILPPLIGFIGAVGTVFGALSAIAVALAVPLGTVAAVAGIVVLAIIAIVAATILVIRHWDDIKGAASAVWGAVSKFVSDAVNRIKTNFNQLKTDASNIKSSISNTVSAVIGFFGRMASGIGDKISSAIGYVKSIPGKIKGALGNLGSLLFGAGKAIIQGLINGIQSLAGVVAGKVKAIAAKVASVAKSALGIHSPSRVFLEIGRNVTQGLANGLEKTAGVSKAASGLTAAVQQGFTAPNLEMKTAQANATGKGSTNGSTNVNITVNVPVGANPIEAGREVQKVLNSYYAAGGTRTT